MSRSVDEADQEVIDCASRAVLFDKDGKIDAAIYYYTVF